MKTHLGSVTSRTNLIFFTGFLFRVFLGRFFAFALRHGGRGQEAIRTRGKVRRGVKVRFARVLYIQVLDFASGHIPPTFHPEKELEWLTEIDQKAYEGGMSLAL